MGHTRLGELPRTRRWLEVMGLLAAGAQACQVATAVIRAAERGLNLAAEQGRAIDALLREPTLTRAAAAAGVSERTLRRWMVEPAFRSALLAARREAFGQAIGLTQRYAPVAVATLVKVMNDAAAGASAKVTAAGVLLRFGRGPRRRPAGAVGGLRPVLPGIAGDGALDAAGGV